MGGRCRPLVSFINVYPVCCHLKLMQYRVSTAIEKLKQSSFREANPPVSRREKSVCVVAESGGCLSPWIILPWFSTRPLTGHRQREDAESHVGVGRRRRRSCLSTLAGLRPSIQALSVGPRSGRQAWSTCPHKSTRYQAWLFALRSKSLLQGLRGRIPRGSIFAKCLRHAPALVHRLLQLPPCLLCGG